MPQSFVVPEDVVLTFESDGVSIEYAGDIVLHGRVGGKPLRRVVSHGGNVTLASAEGADHIEAHGNITVLGAMQATVVKAGGALRVGGDLEAETVDVEGDVDASGGLAVPSLRVNGRLSVRGAAVMQTPTLGGDAEFHGDVAANVLRARNFQFNGGTLSARGVQAQVAVRIGAVRLQVDAIVSPEVTLQPTTSGRAAVIESHNELGASAVKGGFRLAEYAEIFGNVHGFLKERGLTALEATAGAEAGPPDSAPEAEPERRRSRQPKAEPEPEPQPEPEAAPAPVYVEAVLEPEEEPETDRAEPPAESPPLPAEDPPDVIWEPIVDAPRPGDSTSGAFESLRERRRQAEGLSDGGAAADRGPHALQAQLAQTVERIADCYADMEVPPAVERLRTLVAAQSYPEVRAEITNIWSELLKYHQKKGIRIHHQVTTTFNAVNALVKKM